MHKTKFTHYRKEVFLFLEVKYIFRAFFLIKNDKLQTKEKTYFFFSWLTIIITKTSLGSFIIFWFLFLVWKKNAVEWQNLLTKEGSIVTNLSPIQSRFIFKESGWKPSHEIKQWSNHFLMNLSWINDFLMINYP